MAVLYFILREITMTGKIFTDTLYLGSKSLARRSLLDYAQIKYEIIAHGSNEELNFTPATFQDQVLAIAKHKMQTLNFPDPISLDVDYLYALTADTLIRNTTTGEILASQLIANMLSRC